MIAFLMPFVLFLKGFTPQQDNLQVLVRHIQVGKGTIVVSVYSGKEDFLKKPIASQTLKADSTGLSFAFSVPPGDYAIAAYQDVNENGKLDAGAFNIPKEPYGFSNHYRPKFSAPHYDGCLIKVTDHTVETVDLQ